MRLIAISRSAQDASKGNRRRFRYAARGIALALTLAAFSPARADQTETIRVELKLRTGGTLDGLVVDHTEHGLVIVNRKITYVFAWTELESGCAYRTRRDLLIFQGGGLDSLPAEDHYQLGLLMLTLDRTDLAAREFRSARMLNDDYVTLGEKALETYRSEKKEFDLDQPAPMKGASPPRTDADDDVGLAKRIELELQSHYPGIAAPTPRERQREQILKIYEGFGRKVQEVLGPGVVRIESAHFLIWTDWTPRYRDRLTQWCESLYVTLGQHFGLDPSEEVFLAKCPLFCWRSKLRFRKFARLFDGYDGTRAVGYTRSIEKTGHVHLVLLRQGDQRLDFDHFASTLVHEASHAFLHRLHTTRLIPHWVNEGYADLMADRVLGDRCPNRRNATLLARQFVRYDWPIGDLLSNTGPIEVHQYPLAHSVIAYLEELDRSSLAKFIMNLKAGKSTASALAGSFDNLTLSQLETDWRAAVRANDPLANPTSTGSEVLPWRKDRGRGD